MSAPLPPQPLSEWHLPGWGSAVGGVPRPLQAPGGADVSVCPGGLAIALWVPKAHLALISPGRYKAGV